jgi:hypothetical protein
LGVLIDPVTKRPEVGLVAERDNRTVRFDPHYRRPGLLESFGQTNGRGVRYQRYAEDEVRLNPGRWQRASLDLLFDLLESGSELGAE